MFKHKNNSDILQQNIEKILANTGSDILSETESLSRMLFGELPDKLIASKGSRLLSKLDLTGKEAVRA